MKNLLKLVAPISGAVLLVALLGPASPAAAESGVPCVGDNLCTDTFDVTGAPEFWTVPNGVTSIQLFVAAGSGGDGTSESGGAGGGVAGTVSVSPGEELALIVGGGGEGSVLGSAGGYGGGGDAFPGGAGGGGGGSFVFIKSGELWEPLLIAGGGGGGGIGSPGGNGGFTDDSADGKEGNVYTPGATETSPGYVGGNQASLVGQVFTPGRGQSSTDTLTDFGGGGGGYFGGAAGGGGSGHASDRVDSPTGSENFGDGQIVLRFSNFTLSEAALTVAPSDPVAGEPVTLTGTLTQYDVPFGQGTLTFTAYLGGTQVFSRTLPVITEDADPGPFRGTVQTTFVPEEAGEYTFSLAFESAEPFEHAHALAADVVRQVGEAPPAPPGDSDDPDELAETGASSAGAAMLAALGAVLLSGGAILTLMRRRTRH